MLEVGSLVTDNTRFSLWPAADTEGKPWEGLGPLKKVGSLLLRGRERCREAEVPLRPEAELLQNPACVETLGDYFVTLL